ncbi:MAG: VanW family protein, partial [Candidatus Uhrbacteria bacterium]|nr:VanW family protein [Candidatus Uhrbacteria bacterium]
NILYWMALHTELKVVERHHHSFDIFPDSGRTVPFGTGAAVFYNYVDLQFHNPTSSVIQIRVWVTDEHLQGEVRSDNEPTFSYSIVERGHRFVKEDDIVYRENEIIRQHIDRKTGNIVVEESLYKNHSQVLYPVAPEVIVT